MIGKKIPSQSNDKFVNYSQQTTIFHWNWKEILRFVGFITWLTQPIQPKLVEISVGVPPALQQTSIFLFSFNEKWLYGDYILWIYFQYCWDFFSYQYKLWAAVANVRTLFSGRISENSSHTHVHTRPHQRTPTHTIRPHQPNPPNLPTPAYTRT